jgi:LacI family transcriptional regulator
MNDKPKRKSRQRRGAPTIADVARHAGVSPMTVSRVINGETNVRDTTRGAVEVAIDELGYAPNEAARRLAGASQIVIAMLYSDPSAYVSEFLLGGLEQARKSNAQVIVEKCDDEKAALASVRRLVAIGLDGIILAPPLGDSDRLLDSLDSTQIATVAVSSGRTRDRISAVSIDDYEASLTMTRHLIALGHKRIGFILGDPRQNASALRLSGYRDAMSTAGLAMPDCLQAKGLFTYRSGLDAAEQLLDQDPGPTAIFASNDAMAAATIAVAHRRGLDVPRDLTVCGFDDTSIAVTIWPELTTVHQPIADLSRAATDLLLSNIRARKAGSRVRDRHMLLDFTLVRRQSDASPRRQVAALATTQHHKTKIKG